MDASREYPVFVEKKGSVFWFLKQALVVAFICYKEGPEKEEGRLFLDKMISLCRNNDFRRVYSRGKSYVSPVVVLYVLKNRQRVLRVGITTSKKIGNAVQRNRARRVIREAFRPLAPEVHTGYDLVFVARGRTPFVKSTEVQAHLGRQLKAAGLWNEAEKAKSR